MTTTDKTTPCCSVLFSFIYRYVCTVTRIKRSIFPKIKKTHGNMTRIFWKGPPPTPTRNVVVHTFCCYLYHRYLRREKMPIFAHFSLLLLGGVYQNKFPLISLCYSTFLPASHPGTFIRSWRDSVTRNVCLGSKALILLSLRFCNGFIIGF